MSMQSQWTVAQKYRSIPLDPRSVAVLEGAGANVPGRDKLRARSYLSQNDGVGWSFQKLFDPRKTWAALRAEMPHGFDFGLQTLPDNHIKFMIFWPGYDPKGIAFPIELWRRDGPGTGVRDYADLVLEIVRCYDAFFQGCRSQIYKDRPSSPQWDIQTNPHFMVENLGLVEIRHASAGVFYADVEYQPNVQVRTAAAPIPSTTFPRSTKKSVQDDPVFKMPTRVSDEAAEYLWLYLERFPYPSEEQCTRLGAVLGYDVILIRMWFEKNRKKWNGVKVATPKMRLKAALALRKQPGQEAES